MDRNKVRISQVKKEVESLNITTLKKLRTQLRSDIKLGEDKEYEEWTKFKCDGVDCDDCPVVKTCAYTANVNANVDLRYKRALELVEVEIKRRK